MGQTGLCTDCTVVMLVSDPLDHSESFASFSGLQSTVVRLAQPVPDTEVNKEPKPALSHNYALDTYDGRNWLPLLDSV